MDSTAALTQFAFKIAFEIRSLHATLRPMLADNSPWESLFPAGPGRKATTVRMLQVSKRGQPLLLIPAVGDVAARALTLYPAQTLIARFCRQLLWFCLRAGLRPGLKQLTLEVAPSAPFVQFLSTFGKEPVPLFSILAGNPRTEGRRFVFLIYDSNRKPAAVVKAGYGNAAKALIAKETVFLQEVSKFLTGAAGYAPKGLPKLLGTFSDTNVEALALPFCANSSRPAKNGPAEVLLSWVQPETRVRLGDLPDWQKLRSAAGADPQFRAVDERLSGREVAQTLYHGDFVPWNIRVSQSGEWTILDWERGQRAGVPGWDWIHYVLQHALLVRRLPVADAKREVEGLLSSKAFRSYAEISGIAGVERDLLQAYLTNACLIIRPSEGSQALQTLRNA